jgi:nicotinamidase-related amidase
MVEGSGMGATGLSLARHDDLLLTLDQKVAPGHTALVVVDVQNDFVAEGGFFDQARGEMATIQTMIPPLLRLIEHARRAGVLVVLIRAIVRSPGSLGAHDRAQPPPRPQSGEKKKGRDSFHTPRIRRLIRSRLISTTIIIERVG